MLKIVDKAVLNEILELILADFPCKDAEDKFGNKIEENLKEQGVSVDFAEWVSNFDVWGK